MLAAVRTVADIGGARLTLWCPGCDDVHQVGVRGDDGSVPPVEWEWNRDLVNVTLSPSVLVRGVQWVESSSFYRPRHRVAAGAEWACHSFVRDGHWQFLGDSTHELVGLTVPLVALPDWLR